MSQLVQEKQVNLGTSARLNALSQYVLRISFSVSHPIPGHLLCYPRSEASVLVSTCQCRTRVQASVRLGQIIYAGLHGTK